MSDSGTSRPPVTAELVTSLAAIAGVTLTPERAEALAPQAEQHFALLRALDALQPGTSEPMGECRLDRERPAK